MKIYDKTIHPGQNRTVKIPVANLPSGTEIDLVASVFRSENPGPTLLVSGGVHGDEINGIEIVRRAIKNKLFNKLELGAVIAVPLLNIYGFNNYSRGFQDGKDVNRAFPGTKRGSLASRVAYTFTNNILNKCDFAIDFHTGGKSVYNYPQVRYSAEDAASVKLALDLNMPYAIESRLISKSLRKTAFTADIPMVVFEGGESLRMDEFSISEGLRGLKNVLIQRNMIVGDLNSVKTEIFSSKKWIRANKSGVMFLEKKAGDFVRKGEVLGKITNPYNTYQSKVIAKVEGYIFGHNNNPVVNKGDALFHIGYNEVE